MNIQHTPLRTSLLSQRIGYMTILAFSLGAAFIIALFSGSAVEFLSASPLAVQEEASCPLIETTSPWTEDWLTAFSTAICHRPDHVLPGSSERLILTSIDLLEGSSWAVATLILRPEEMPAEYETLLHFPGVLVLGKLQDESPVVAFEGTNEFERVVSDNPSRIFDEESQQTLLNLATSKRPNQLNNVSMKWPWKGGQTWLYSYGIHGTNSSAIDFAPFQSIPGTQREIVAAAKGTVLRRCDDNFQSDIILVHSGNFATGYLHLDRGSTAHLSAGQTVSQGGRLGHTYNASNYSTSCGVGNGPHLHFHVGTVSGSSFTSQPIAGIVLSDWTLSSNSCFIKTNHSAICPGSSVTSDNHTNTPYGSIDAPTPETWHKGTVRIRGWAKVDNSAISRVEIWINGVNRGNATYGTSHPGAGGNYGYYWDWNTAQYSDGTHNVRVKAVASNGTNSWLTANNTGSSTTLPVKTDNRAPSNPTAVNPGCSAASNQWQNSCNDPNFTWSGASDGSGIGVKDYQYYWGPNSNGSPTTYTTNPGFNPPAVPEPVAVYFLRIAARDQLNQQNPHPSTLFILRYDSVPPEVAMLINNGSTVANQVNVTLDFTASDIGSGVDQVRVSNNGLNWSHWQPYQNAVSWTLPSLNRQTHTIYVQVKDKAGNLSETASASIMLDLYPVMPHSANYRICADVINVGGQAGLQSGSYQLTSSIGETGIASGQSSSYRGQGGFLADLTACLPIEHAAGEAYEITNWVIASGGSLRGSTSYLLGDTTGEAFASSQHEFSSSNYRLTSGFWANLDTIAAPPPPPPPPPPTVTPPPSPTPGPTPTPIPGGFGITINDGALYTNSEHVTVRVSAPNVTQMRLSNDGGYNNDGWMSYHTTTSWTISSFGNYVLPRFVYAWFRDADGTVYGTYMDDIIYDPIPPEGNIEVLFEYPDGDSVLYLYATDDNSGVADMLISEDPTFAGAEWQDYEQFITWTGTGNPIYAQFRDRAGNLSPVYSTELVDGLHRLYLPTILR